MKVPVIVMTNLNQEEDKKRAFDLGATSFFVKSNSPISQIVASIKSILDPPSVEDSIPEATPVINTPSEYIPILK